MNRCYPLIVQTFADFPYTSWYNNGYLYIIVYILYIIGAYRQKWMSNLIVLPIFQITFQLLLAYLHTLVLLHNRELFLLSTSGLYI